MAWTAGYRVTAAAYACIAARADWWMADKPTGGTDARQFTGGLICMLPGRQSRAEDLAPPCCHCIDNKLDAVIIGKREAEKG
jgi:hypothetical protein